MRDSEYTPELLALIGRMHREVNERLQREAEEERRERAISFLSAVADLLDPPADPAA